MGVQIDFHQTCIFDATSRYLASTFIKKIQKCSEHLGSVVGYRMAPILDIEVECGEQKSRLLRGMVVLRGTVNYCIGRRLVRIEAKDSAVDYRVRFHPPPGYLIFNTMLWAYMLMLNCNLCALFPRFNIGHAGPSFNERDSRTSIPSITSSRGREIYRRHGYWVRGVWEPSWI